MYSERQVRRLVLIDEDPILAQLVRELLENQRRVLYRVAHFTHCVEALTYFRLNPVDIVLVGPSPQDGDTEAGSCGYEGLGNTSSNSLRIVNTFNSQHLER